MTISKFAKNGLLLAGLLSAPLCVASEPLYDSASLPQNIADDDKDGCIDDNAVDNDGHGRYTGDGEDYDADDGDGDLGDDDAG